MTPAAITPAAITPTAVTPAAAPRRTSRLRALVTAGAFAAALGGAFGGGQGGVAQAQVAVSRNAFESPQRFALELRLGPYLPEVDEEFGAGNTPYRDFFGTDRGLMYQVEFDYQFFDRSGTAAVGVSLGYFRDTGKAFVEPGAGLPATKRSGDESRLSLYPTAVMLVYRADQAYRLWRLPVVPYAKLGLNYTLWRISDGNGLVAEGGTLGGRGRGATFGWQGAIGASLVLDFIDPGSARTLDVESGINRTHLFVELAKYSVSGLGQDGRLHVGDTTWLGGLLFEF